MIEFNSVTKKYKKGDRIILKDVSLILPSTGIVVLKGKNASGKTTFLNLIAGLTRPTLGTIKINNILLNELSSRELSHFR